MPPYPHDGTSGIPETKCTLRTAGTASANGLVSAAANPFHTETPEPAEPMTLCRRAICALHAWSQGEQVPLDDALHCTDVALQAATAALQVCCSSMKESREAGSRSHPRSLHGTAAGGIHGATALMRSLLDIVSVQDRWGEAVHLETPVWMDASYWRQVGGAFNL